MINIFSLSLTNETKCIEYDCWIQLIHVACGLQPTNRSKRSNRWKETICVKNRVTPKKRWPIWLIEQPRVVITNLFALRAKVFSCGVNSTITHVIVAIYSFLPRLNAFALKTHQNASKTAFESTANDRIIANCNLQLISMNVLLSNHLCRSRRRAIYMLVN